MTPYYDRDGITIYHGDAREVVPTLGEVDVVITDPPYPNNAGHFADGVEAARAVLAALSVRTALVFWTELEKPPVPLPLWRSTSGTARTSMAGLTSRSIISLPTAGSAGVK